MSRVNPYLDNSEAQCHNFHQLEVSSSDKLLNSYVQETEKATLRSLMSSERKRKSLTSKLDEWTEENVGLQKIFQTTYGLDHDLPSVLERLENDAISVLEFSGDVKCMAPWSKGVVVALENGRVALVKFGYKGIVDLSGECHSGRVTCIAISPDGKMFVSGSSDKTLALWSLATRRRERTLIGHTQAVSCAAITHDGRFIVSGSFDGTVRVWTMEEGRETMVLRGHSEEVSCLVVTPDSKRVISGSFDRTLRVWALDKSGAVQGLSGHGGYIECLAVTNTHVVSGSRDHIAKVWEIASGTLVSSLLGHSHFVSCVCITRNNQHVVTGSFDKTLKIWELSDGSLLTTLLGHTHFVSCVVLSDDEDLIVSGSYDKTVKVWSFGMKCEIATLKGHTHFVSSLVLAVDGQYIASGSWDSTVRMWSLARRAEVTTLYKHTDWVNCLSITPNGEFIVSGSKDKTVKVWSVADECELATFRGHTEEVSCLCVTPDAKHVISASFWQIKAWSLEDQRDPFTFSGHTDTVKCLAVTPDSRYFVSGSRDTTVRMWSLYDLCEVACFQGHVGEVNCLAITPNGQLVVSAADDGVLKVWSTKDQAEVASLERHAGYVKCLAVTSNGELAVSACFAGQLKVWSLLSMQLVAALEGHKVAILCLCVTPDSRLAVTGSDDGELKVWSLEHFRELAALEGHSHFVTCLCCAPNGKHILSGSVSLDSRRGEIKIWSMEELMLVTTLSVHSDAVWCLCISPDSQRAISGSYDTTVVEQDMSAIVSSKAFVYPESIVSATNCWLAFSIEEMLRGRLTHRQVYMARVSPHNFNCLHISAYYNQPETFTAYLKAGAPILRGAYGSPLTVALSRNSKRCVDVLTEHLTLICQQESGCISLRLFAEDLPLLLLRNSSHLIPLFRTLLCESAQARLPQFIIPIKHLPIMRFADIRVVDVKEFARFRGNKFVENTLHLVEFWVSLFRWNFCPGSTPSLVFLKALERCENRSVLTTPFVLTIVETKWDLFFPLTLTLAGTNLLLIVLLVALVFGYWEELVLCSMFLIVNLLLLVYEVVQALGQGNSYWQDCWNLVDVARGLLSLLWSAQLFAGTDSQYMRLFVVLTCFLGGFVHFRAFTATRIFVFTMTKVIQEIYSFLIILAYSVFGFGVLASVMTENDGAATSLTIAFNLLMNNFDNSSFGVTQWLVFIAANVVNVIIMLNLLISIIGDAFEKAQMQLREYNVLQMLHLVIEYEGMLFWRRSMGRTTVLVKCRPAASSVDEDEWAGRINKITKSVAEGTALLLSDVRRETQEAFSASGKQVEALCVQLSSLETRLRTIERKLDVPRTAPNSAVIDSLDARMAKIEATLDVIVASLRNSSNA